MKPADLPIFKHGTQARAILDKELRSRGLTIGLLRDLVEISTEQDGKGRAKGITPEFDSAFDEFLRERE